VHGCTVYGPKDGNPIGQLSALSGTYAPVAQPDRAPAFRHEQFHVRIRSLYGKTEPIKWIALYRGNLNSQADGNPEETWECRDP